MMKKAKLFVAGCITAGFLASCSTTMPYAATNNPIGSKTGKSETTCVFGLAAPPYPGGSIVASGSIVLNGDYGIVEACKDGGIDKIATVDVKVKNFGIFSKYTLIVTGE